MIFDREHECMGRAELERLQSERLVALARRVYDRVPFYRRHFDEAGIAPEQVRGLADLGRLPFTRKYNLRDEYPFGLFATPMKDVVRIHASSGTTGKPTTVGYTRNDIAMWANVCARALAGAGTTQDDVVQVAYGYGLFTGGLGAHYGAELIGASVIPISGSNTQRQLMLMQDFGTTVICCTPSFMLYLYDVAQQLDLDVKKFPLKVGVFGAEPWSEAMRRDIERKWDIKACDIYGLSEIIGPGVSCECVEAQSGLHLNDDHFLPEIIDPETGEILAEGRDGRTGGHHPHQGSLPAHPLPDGRHHPPHDRAVHLRTHQHPHGPRLRPDRRHAHHPRRERLPQPGGVGAAHVPAGGAALPLDRHAQGRHGQYGGPGGDQAGSLPRGLRGHPLHGRRDHHLRA